jgi:hypothetical protein
MSRVPTVRKADLDRVLKALADRGQHAATIIVRPGGEVEITPALTTDAPGAQGGDELAAWREKRRGRAADQRS